MRTFALPLPLFWRGGGSTDSLFRKLNKSILFLAILLTVFLLFAGTAAASTIYVTNTTFSQIGDGNSYSDNNPSGASTVTWGLSDDYILIEDIILEDSWKAIGEYAAADRFNGSLNGYYSTSNEFYTITIMSTTVDPFEFTSGSHASDGYGLFGTVSNAEFKNLTINVNSDIIAMGNNPNYVGILAGRLMASRTVIIDNCIVQSTMTPFPMVSSGSLGSGGMIGTAAGTLTLTNSEVKNIHVMGGNHVGGFIGRTQNTVILNADSCIFSGDVEGNNRVGGFIGNFTTDSNSLFNRIQVQGTINGTHTLGGLIGTIDPDTGTTPNIKITNSVSHADIYSDFLANSSLVGGLVGHLRETTIEDSYATGNISAEGGMIGGLVGSCDNSTILRSYATGNVFVSGTYITGVGGLVGQMIGSTSLISESYSTGSVTGAYSGGFIGRIVEGTIQNCYSTGHVIGSVCGGFVGKVLDSSSTVIENCYSTGDVSGPLIAEGSPISGGFIGDIGSTRRAFATNADVSITDSISFGRYVLGQQNAGKFIGSVSFSDVLTERENPIDSTMDVEIQNSYYWDNAYLRGRYVEPIDYSITTPFIFTGTVSVSASGISKENVWFTYDPLNQPAIWSAWADTIWTLDSDPDATYGLPVFIWQIAANAPIPDGTGLFTLYTPSSGGSSTGGATISNNGSSPAPTDTTTPVQNNNTQPVNNTTPHVSESTEGGEKSTNYITWLIIGGVLIIVAVAAVFGYRYYNNNKM